MMNVFLIIVTVGAIGFAFVCYMAYRYARRVIATQRKSLAEVNETLAACQNKRDEYGDAGVELSGKLVIVTEERDALAAELQLLKATFRRWKCRFAGSENRLAATVVQLREAASVFNSDVHALDAWTAAQTDERPGELPGDDDPFENQVGDDDNVEEHAPSDWTIVRRAAPIEKKEQPESEEWDCTACQIPCHLASLMDNRTPSSSPYKCPFADWDKVKWALSDPEERAPVEKDEQPGKEVTAEAFRASVEAAGLGVRFRSKTCWEITGGTRESTVTVWVGGKELHCGYGNAYERSEPLDSVADAIKLAGPPVKGEATKESVRADVEATAEIVTPARYGVIDSCPSPIGELNE